MLEHARRNVIMDPKSLHRAVRMCEVRVYIIHMEFFFSHAKGRAWQTEFSCDTWDANMCHV